MNATPRAAPRQEVAVSDRLGGVGGELAVRLVPGNESGQGDQQHAPSTDPRQPIVNAPTSSAGDANTSPSSASA
jgi:hypothetical protein